MNPQADIEDADRLGKNPENAERVKTQAGDRLRSLVERIERLEEERRDLGSDIKDIFAEAKGAGFDVKALRAVLKLRRLDAQERSEMDAIVDLYCAELGL
jgi:uncharacterized protein (UPF0335 family)